MTASTPGPGGPVRLRPGRDARRLHRPLRPRTHGMTASEIRALFAVASPAGGRQPGRRHAEPVGAAARRGRQADGRARSARGEQALQYGSGQGDPLLRELICEVMALEGIVATPEDVVVTVGSQQALDLVTRVFIDPGDVVIAEAPSYVGALGTFSAYQADVVHVAMDERRTRARGAARARSTRSRPRASARSSSTRCRTSTTPPASRWPSRVARRSSRSARRPG